MKKEFDENMFVGLGAIRKITERIKASMQHMMTMAYPSGYATDHNSVLCKLKNRKTH